MWWLEALVSVGTISGSPGSYQGSCQSFSSSPPPQTGRSSMCQMKGIFFLNSHEHKRQFLFFLFADWCFSVCQQHWQWALCGNSRNSSSWRNCHRRLWVECKWNICQWKYLWHLDYLQSFIKITLPHNLGLSKFVLGNTCVLHRPGRANVIWYLTCPSHWKKDDTFQLRLFRKHLNQSWWIFFSMHIFLLLLMSLWRTFSECRMLGRIYQVCNPWKFLHHFAM